MLSILDNSNNFSALSVKDLLLARDRYHDLLLSKKNVIATAIGLYRIRRADEWLTRKKQPRKKDQPARTLFNSEVRNYSWPCIYVFVSQWASEAELSKSPADLIPKTLYIDEGRAVPVCVIEAKKQNYSSDASIDLANIYPRNSFVPGTPILNEDAQGLPRLATAGCIVKDGERYYVLTNKHAIGKPGTEICAFKSYQQVVIGRTAEKGITRMPVKDVYPGFASSKQYMQLDVGLIEVEDITEWQTKVIQVGEVQTILDLYDNNINLKLIGQKVVGHGAVSGLLRGEIQGLFYRYKAMGGYEYLSDFLIGPDTEIQTKKMKGIDKRKNVSFGVSHGDSGALLLIEEKVMDEKGKKVTGYNYHPFGLLWGKHEFIENNSRTVQPYALATSLSTSLNFLELDFVRDINLDNEFTWGYIGHYAIASKLNFAIGILKIPKLKAFVTKNKDLLSMKDDEIKTVADSPRVVRKIDKTHYDTQTMHFVPLADVADNVWKSNVNVYKVDVNGTKKTAHGKGSRAKKDNPNHFADTDQKNSANDSLMSLYLKNADKYLRPKEWLKYYASVETEHKKWDLLYSGKFIKEKHWGALPFRVWQIVDEMIGFVKAGNQKSFFCAGGILIHYLGDACQPLHSSYLADGDPEVPTKRKITKGPNEGEFKTEPKGKGAHVGYEDEMVDEMAKEIMNKMEAEIKRLKTKETIRPIKSGYDAACAVMDLLIATQKTISPRKIVNKWADVKGLKKPDRIGEMKKAFGKKTIEVMARGALYLARIWEGAWKQGGGNTKIGAGSVLKEKDMQTLYEKDSFLPSLRLDQYSLKKNGQPV